MPLRYLIGFTLLHFRNIQLNKSVCFVFVEYKQSLGFVSIDRIRDATMILIYTFM